MKSVVHTKVVRLFFKLNGELMGSARVVPNVFKVKHKNFCNDACSDQIWENLECMDRYKNLYALFSNHLEPFWHYP